MTALEAADAMLASDGGRSGTAGWHAVRRSSPTAALIVLAVLIAGGGLLAVITAGFSLSFDAIRAVGRASGMRTDLAWLLPAAVDGAMAVGTVTAVVVRRLQRSTIYPWTAVLANTAISVACNGLHAYQGASRMALPTAVAVAVSAVPAVNLALSVHLLVVLVDVLTDALMERDTPAMRSSTEDGEQRALVLERPDTGGSAAMPEDAEGTDLAPLADVRQLSGRQLQQTAWKWALQNRRVDGSLPSGSEIAKAHSRSPRWGRLVRNAGLSGHLDVDRCAYSDMNP